MNMYSNEYLLDELELAETKEERHKAIVRILEERPEIRALMQELILMKRSDRDQAVNILTEAVKPHTVSM